MTTIKDIHIYSWGYEICINGRMAVWNSCGKNKYVLRIQTDIGRDNYNILASQMIDALLSLGHIPVLSKTKRNYAFLCKYPQYIKHLRNGLFLDI